MVMSWTTKEKNFWTYLAILKMVPGTFWDWAQKTKTNLDFQRIFDNLVAKYLICKEFHECINYIFGYFPKKLEKVQKISTLNFFKETLYGPFHGWSLLSQGYKATAWRQFNFYL